MQVGLLQTGLRESIAESIQAIGLKCWGIEMVARGSVLRVYIDKATGVNLQDCTEATRIISPLLDAEDSLPEGYTLEVSSPGVDRLLFEPEHWSDSIGNVIAVQLLEPVEGRKRLKGRLDRVNDRKALLKEDRKSYWIPFNQVKRARVVPELRLENG